MPQSKLVQPTSHAHAPLTQLPCFVQLFGHGAASAVASSASLAQPLSMAEAELDFTKKGCVKVV